MKLHITGCLAHDLLLYSKTFFSECTEVRCKRNVVDRHNAAGFVLLSKSVFVFLKFFFRYLVVLRGQCDRLNRSNANRSINRVLKRVQTDVIIGSTIWSESDNSPSGWETVEVSPVVISDDAAIRRQRDVSHISIVRWVETIRIPRAGSRAVLV